MLKAACAVFSERLGCEITEMNVQADHVHLFAMVPPKISMSDYLETIKGRTAIRILGKHKNPGQKPYGGNHLCCGPELVIRNINLVRLF